MKNKKTFIEKNKDLIILILLLTIGVLLVMLPSFIQGTYFIGGGDVKTQSYEFFLLYKREIINAIRNKTLPFWSWIVFLGNNIWCSKLFYGMFDIFNIITYLLPFNYYVIYAIQCWLKIVVAGIGFYYLLSYFVTNKRNRLIGGLCYGLSSYAIYFLSSPNLLTPYALMPLYFIGIEKYFKTHKTVFFIIISTILFYAQFYTLFAITAFSPIYFIYRYYNIKNKLKGFLKEALPLIGAYLIAFMLAGVVIVPEIFYLLQNERVGAFDSSLIFEDLSVLLHLLIASFVPSQDYIYANNIFDQGAHALKELCLFSSSLTCLLLPQLFTLRNKYFKKSTIILIIVMTILLLTPIGNSIMVGFSEVNFRWTLIIIMMNIIIVIKIFSDEIINKKCLLYTLMIEALTCVVIFGLAIIYKQEAFTNYIKQLTIVLTTIGLSCLICYAIYKDKEKSLITIVVIQLFVNGIVFGINVKTNGDSPMFMKEVSTVLADDSDYHNLKNYLNSLDDKNNEIFYRTYISHDSLYWGYSHNFNIIYNLEGLMTYDSAYQPSFNFMRNKFYDDLVGEIPWELSIEEPTLLNIYSTKYSITINEDEIPFNNYKVVDYEYQGGLIVAENLEYQAIGKTYSKAFSYDDYECVYNLDVELLNDSVICYNPNDIESYMESTQTHELENINYSTNKLTGEIYSDADSFMVIGVPYDEGWNIKVNGEKVQTYQVNGGVIGVPIFEGNNYIEMNFVPKGFKAGLIMSLVGTGILVYTIVIEKRKKNI